MVVRNKTTNIYTEWKPLIDALSDEDAGKVFKFIFDYQSGVDINSSNPVWLFIKSKIDDYNEKGKQVSEKRRKNGKLGGLAKASKCQQELANDGNSSNKIKENKIKENKINNNILPEQEDEGDDDRDNPKWTDLDRWEKGWVDRTKYQMCYKGIVPLDWKPTKEDYEKSGGYPWLYNNLPNRFVFEGKIIKLDEKDYNKWKKEFPNIDLKEELYSLDLFYQEEKENGKNVKGWIFRVPKVLQKKNIQNKRQIKEYW